MAANNKNRITRKEELIILQDTAIAIAVIDSNHKIIKSNDYWDEIVDKNFLYELKTNKLENKEIKINSNKKSYQVNIIDNKEYGFIVYLSEILIKKIFDNSVQNTIVSYLFIDNYDEVIEEMNSENIPLISAVIERKLNEFARRINAIIKKLEKNKFLLIFTRDYLDKLVEDRFSILNQVKEINFGNKIPITLSIGIAIPKTSLYEAEISATAALSLALGRGGDQALIKDGDKYSFFGGSSKIVERSSRVKARVKAYALEELIKTSNNILIMSHKNPDFDSLGSSIGIFRVAKSFNKNAHIVLAGPSVAIKPLYDLLLEESIYENLFITEDEAFEKLTTNTLVVIVDTHRPSIVESKALAMASNKNIVFDHHRRSTEYIDNIVLSYHEPAASSTSEQVCEMLLYISKTVKLTNLESDALLAGITLDTKNFTVKTGVKTFEAAAFLKRRGADSTRVRNLFRTDLNLNKSVNMVIDEARIFRKKIAISQVESGGQDSIVIAAQAADRLLNIVGIEAAFVFSKIDDTIFVSARSFDKMNVQIISEKLGGGGHRNVAGVQFNNIEITDAIKLIKKAVLEYIEEEA